MMMEAFSKASGARAEELGGGLVSAIHAERPALKGLTETFTEAGKTSYTLIIGNEVFKGFRLNKSARQAQSEESFEKEKNKRFAAFMTEIETLRALEGSKLPVPKVTCVGENALFYGMTLEPGVVLGDVFKSFTPQQRSQLARDIAKFIMEMARALPAKDGNYAKHADLHHHNILVDPQTKRLTAVVDFGRILYLPANRLASTAVDDIEFNNMVAQEFERRKARLAARATRGASTP